MIRSPFQERPALLVEPVKVLSQQNEDLLFAATSGDPPERPEQAVHPNLGGQLGSGSVGVGDLQKVAQQRQVVVQLGIERQQPAGDLVPRHAGTVGLPDVEIVPQERKDGQEGDVIGVGDSACSADGDPSPLGVAGELVTKPTFAYPCLADDAYHLGMTGFGQRQGVFQYGEFPVPTDQRRRADRRTDTGRERSAEHMDPKRRGGALHRPRTPRLKPKPTVDQPGRVLGQIGVPRLGDRLHPLGQADGVPQRRRVERQVAADPADDHLPRVQPQPHMQLEALLRPELVGVLTDRLRQMPGGMTGPAGMVLLSHRRPEQRHDAVAGELVHRPAELRDPFGQNGDEPGHDPRPDLRIQPLLQVHRPGHIGEENGDVLPFAAGRARRR
jgi:hypothetical protein